MNKNQDFLLEIGTEELPPNNLITLSDSLREEVAKGLNKKNLTYKKIKTYATPRRLSLIVYDLANKQKKETVLQKGPPLHIAFDKNNKPTKATRAFAKKCGCSVEELKTKTSEKGSWLIYEKTIQGSPTKNIIPLIIKQALENLPIARKMKWGQNNYEFVRPVHSLIMLHGKKIIPYKLFGINSGNISFGHRVHCSKKLIIDHPENYIKKLKTQGSVLVDFNERKKLILSAIINESKKLNGTPIYNEEFLNEVTGLTEFPVPVKGSFNKEYLSLPKEVIIATLQNHQRYFPIASKNGRLLPNFITISNIKARRVDAKNTAVRSLDPVVLTIK